MAKIKEIEEYRPLAMKAELHKAVNTLSGIIAGITTDNEISDDETNELANWCLLHQNLETKHPFCELIPKIKEAYEDKIITEEEKKDIIWMCNSLVSDSVYYDLATSSLQFLFGLFHGVMADGKLTDDEIKKIQKWVRDNDFMQGCYPFDEIRSLLSTVLFDGIVTTEERGLLIAFMSEFIDTSESYNLSEHEMESLRTKYSISGICSLCDEIDFEDHLFCFTGKSSQASRKEIVSAINYHGGKYNDRITKNTDYLIVGSLGNPCWAYSCYGRKVEEAVNIRKNGGKIKIISETDFWDVIEDIE